MNSILDAVEQYVSTLLREKLPESFTYHNLMHTREVTASATEIGKNSGLSKKELELVLIATWFHDAGFTVSYKGHEKESIKIARDFLKNFELSEEDLNTIERLIEVTELDVPPVSRMEEVIKDADILNIGQDIFFVTNKRIKKERETIENREIDEKDWLYSTMHFIMDTDFYTEYARKNYGNRRKENINLLSERLKEYGINV